MWARTPLKRVDLALASSGGGNGTNWGWADCEGNFGSCAGSEPPVVVYPNPAEGCSVIGGYVYRGCAMPGHHGRYFYSDYCGAFIRSFRLMGAAIGDAMDHSAGFAGINDISTFGEDARGELYIADLGGQVYRIVPQ